MSANALVATALLTGGGGGAIARILPRPSKGRRIFQWRQGGGTDILNVSTGESEVMARSIILVVRHAEKPDGRLGSGVAQAGTIDKESLTVRGWQRAGALTHL